MWLRIHELLLSYHRPVARKIMLVDGCSEAVSEPHQSFAHLMQLICHVSNRRQSAAEPRTRLLVDI
jgi:hypothetical protein